MLYHLTSVLSAAPLLKRDWHKKSRLALQNAVRFALPKHRASACLRHRLGMSAVIVSATKSGKTRMGGLMVCNSFHVCPICHHNKMNSDKATLAEIVSKHYAAGGFMIDAVLTVPHSASESLAVVQNRLESVWKSMRSKSISRVLEEELGIVGSIRRLEVTLTANGWHPHYHVSFLCDWQKAKGIKGYTRDGALADAHALVAGQWSEAGKREGIKVCLFAQAAVAIVAAVDAAKAITYNAKNMGYETNTSDSLTPMDLLRIINQVNDPSAMYAAKRLFCEYAEVIKGKHTLSYLGTARTAKNEVNLSETRHSSSHDQEEHERLGVISPDGWSAVIKAQLREVVAQVSNREELATNILQAAVFFGHASIPSGWLTLAPEPEIKTVIDIKRKPPDKPFSKHHMGCT